MSESFRRPGPKVSLESLESKVIDLETRLLELKALLLSSPSFVSQNNRSKFILSPRFTTTSRRWDEWLAGAEVPAGAAQGPEHQVPDVVPEVKRSAGRPTKLSKLLERDYVNGVMAERGCTEVEAREFLRAEQAAGRL